MKKYISILCGVITLILSSAVLTASGKHDGSYLHNLTMDYETPHYQWCGKFAGGTIDAMFILPRRRARGAVEMAQRFDLKLSAVTTVRTDMLAKNNIYDGACTGTSSYEKDKEVIEKVSVKHDVFILGNFVFTALPAEAQLKILQQVKDGAGLVITYPRRLPYKKLYLHPLKDASLEVLRLAPNVGLPEKPRQVKPERLIKAWSLGKGRIVAIYYRDTHSVYYSGMALEARDPWSPEWAALYENNMVLLLRAMMYASGWESPVKVSCPEFKNAPSLPQGKRKISLQLSKAAEGTVDVRIRNKSNKVVFKDEISVKDKTEYSFELPILTAGRYYSDLIYKDQSGKVADFGYEVFDIASPTGKITLEMPQESFKPGEAIKAKLVLEKPLATDSKVDIELKDSPYGRIWNVASLDLQAGQKEVNIEIKSPRVPTLAGFLECSIVEQGKKIASTEKAIFIRHPYTDPYVQMVWDSIPNDYAPFFAKQIVDGIGWNCGLTGVSPYCPTPRTAAFFNQRLVPYIARVMMAPEDVKNLRMARDKKETEKIPPKGWTRFNWMGLRSKEMKKEIKTLNGDESLYNPKARKLISKHIQGQVAELPKFAPLTYNLGDENSFSYDAGYSPSANEEFTRFVERKYKTIEALNAAWNSSYKNFKEVPHLKLNEAKNQKNYAAWFDQRQFMEKAYADLHHFLAAEIRKVDPGAKVGAEGSRPAEMEQTIDTLEFWGPYSRLCGNELLRSIGPEKIRMHWWGGYVGSHGGRGKYPMPLWQSLLAGTVNGSAWFAGGVSSEGMLGADLSYAAYFKDLIPHLRALKNGIAQLLITTPLKDDKIAVLWSHASDAARLLESRFINPTDSTGTLIKFCHRNGINFEMVTPKRINQGALKGKKVLFLFGISSISDETAKTISEFASNGGIVIADMNPGILTEKLAIRKDNNPLKELFGNILLDKLKAPEMKSLSVKTTFRDIKLSLDSKKALINPDSKLLTSQKTGKGETLLLNFCLSSASLTTSKTQLFDDFMLKLLAACDIRPSVKVTGLKDSNCMLRVRANSRFELVGYLAQKADVGKAVTFEIAKAKYIYKPGQGYIGKSNSWKTKLDSPFALYSLFDSEQSAPKISLDSPQVSKGGQVILNLSGFETGDVLYQRLADPKGKIDPTTSKVLVIDGKTKSETLNFAFNAQEGDWKLSLENIASGLKSTAEIKVK